MSENEEVTFQDTINWATSVNERKTGRKKGIHLFYLILGAIVVLILIILIVYLIGRDPEETVDALELMQDEQYATSGVEDVIVEELELEGTERFGVGLEGELEEGDDGVEYEYIDEYVDPSDVYDGDEVVYEYVDIPTGDQ